MPAIKSAAEIAEKWARVTPGRATDYVEGAKGAGAKWEEGAKAAKDAYEAGIRDAIGRGAREKGIERAGAAKFNAGIVNKGSRRWPEGVRVSKGEYQKGFAPYRDVIERVDLPPRGTKGDPRNYDRVKAIGEALHAAKIGS